MKDDPRRPYKAIVAAVAAAATAVVTVGVGLPYWLVLVCTVIAAGGGAYLKTNPKIN